jgi:hypothetical protein
MKSTATWKKTNSLAGGRRKKRGKQDRSQVSLGIVSRTRIICPGGKWFTRPKACIKQE